MLGRTVGLFLQCVPEAKGRKRCKKSVASGLRSSWDVRQREVWQGFGLSDFRKLSGNDASWFCGEMGAGANLGEYSGEIVVKVCLDSSKEVCLWRISKNFKKPLLKGWEKRLSTPEIHPIDVYLGPIICLLCTSCWAYTQWWIKQDLPNTSRVKKTFLPSIVKTSKLMIISYYFRCNSYSNSPSCPKMFFWADMSKPGSNLRPHTTCGYYVPWVSLKLESFSFFLTDFLFFIILIFVSFI